jgi:hypothetical protein
VIRGSIKRYAAAAVMAGALVAGAAGCSFIFDFTECEADADCQQFDSPEAGEFYVCSADDKCVLEPERECRTDAHCADGQTCDVASGVCGE